MGDSSDHVVSTALRLETRSIYKIGTTKANTSTNTTCVWSVQYHPRYHCPLKHHTLKTLTKSKKCLNQNKVP